MKPKSPVENAFSMIEIALALGIIGMALVSLLGLMAIGMSTAKDATDETQMAMIVNRLVADRQNSPFENSSVIYGIPDLKDTAWTPVTFPLYFSRNGTTNASPAVGTTYFKAELSKPTPTPSPISAQVNIKVLWPYRGASAPLNTNSFSTIITRNRP